MNRDPAADFVLDPRLAADTAPVIDWALCRVLLMDDARFPWLVLVPRRAGLREFDDLDADAGMLLMHEIRSAMQALRGVTGRRKFNVGALGNIVHMLHVHVVARRDDDDAWPGPAWGSGPARRYTSAERARLMADLRLACSRLEQDPA